MKQNTTKNIGYFLFMVFFKIKINYSLSEYYCVQIINTRNNFHTHKTFYHFTSCEQFATVLIINF